jgi:hypothetical protein
MEVRDRKAHAISYYCSSEPFSDKTHAEELAKLLHLQRRLATDPFSDTGDPDVSDDLDRNRYAGASETRDRLLESGSRNTATIGPWNQ